MEELIYNYERIDVVHCKQRAYCYDDTSVNYTLNILRTWKELWPGSEQGAEDAINSEKQTRFLIRMCSTIQNTTYYAN